jgi:hypothetical protein
MFVSLGKITVPTPGTPVSLATKTTNCNGVFFQALSANTGKVYIGLNGMVKATFTNVMRVLVPPPATPLTLDSWSPQGITIAPIDISTILVDADNPNEGILLCYLVN